MDDKILKEFTRIYNFAGEPLFKTSKLDKYKKIINVNKKKKRTKKNFLVPIYDTVLSKVLTYDKN